MRRVCFVLTNRTQYGRSKYMMRTIQEHPELELQVVVAGSALLPKYGDVASACIVDGFPVNERITMLVEGGSPVAMAKTTGLGLIEFTTAFENLKPDIALLRGDRYEMLSSAIVASYLNIRIAHIEGGDLSGTIDESVRHAISKLAHIHFPTNNDSANRLIRMGENSEHVHDIGSLDIEYLTTLDFDQPVDLENAGQKGSGATLDLSKPYLVVLQHPVTTEYGAGRDQFEATVKAIEELKIPTIWFWPNTDAGHDEASKAIRVARDQGRLDHVHFFRSIAPEPFLRLVNGASCLIGNTSAGIKECSWLGTPVVNVGTRQNGRLRAKNVTDVTYEASAILEAVRQQVEQGRYPQSSIYHKAGASSALAEILATSTAPVQKSWTE